MKYFLNLLISSILFIYPFNDVFATHAAGMDISFECVARNSTSDFYKITVSFYRDCNGTAAPGSLDMEYSCGNNIYFNEFFTHFYRSGHNRNRNGSSSGKRDIKKKKS